MVTVILADRRLEGIASRMFIPAPIDYRGFRVFGRS